MKVAPLHSLTRAVSPPSELPKPRGEKGAAELFEKVLRDIARPTKALELPTQVGNEMRSLLTLQGMASRTHVVVEVVSKIADSALAIGRKVTQGS